MCGICGALTFGDPGFIRPVPDLVPLMVRRGPDDAGNWSDGDCCAFGFRRLSILDLSPAGHQPMVSRDGRYALVFNGEVYNFRELRKELEGGGHVFASTGDSEVVLHALAQWGREALARFNGMFALGFYDGRARRLLLARDHAGIKPLYYLRGPDGVVFASQYDQILAHPASRDRAVSRDALALYLRLGYIPAPYALLEGTHMLPPGGWLEAEANGTVRQGEFFGFPRYGEPTLRGAEAMEAVDAAVTAAVRRQLVSDVPVGVFLSGGVDSPLVAAKIRAGGNSTVKAFTIGTAGDASDESADAQAYAREIGIDHVVEHIRPDDSLALLDDVIAACGEPFGDFSIFPTMLVSRLARREVKVMLSGDGGDELFWGYVSRFGEVIGKAPDFGSPLWWRTARWAASRYLGIGSGYYNLCYPFIGRWYRDKHSHLHDAEIAAFFGDALPWPAGFDHYDYTGSDRDRTAQWARWNEVTGRMNMILQKVDRASMHESLEVRVPLLDREVVDVAARIDWRSCIDLDRKIGKQPLRNALARHVRHQTQAKRGFTVPMWKWLQGPLRRQFEESVLDRRELLGLELNGTALRKSFRRFVDEGAGGAWGFWLLLSLSLWEQRHRRR